MVLSLAVLLGALDEPLFVDRTVELGVGRSGSAACWVDLDNDGWVDLVAGGKVWMNQKGERFEARGEALNVVSADFDNDGFADLFSWSTMKLYRNLGGKGFEEMALPEGVSTVSRGACWGDFNGDGFVDLYIGGYESWEPQATYPDLLLLNKGGTGFELAWQDVRYRARGVTACDFDRDGDLDVYVSNYRLQPNVLWVNDGTGKFADRASELGVLATSAGFGGGHSIGACWGDFDNDGEMDLFAGNFAHVDSRGDQPKSRFLRNLGAGRGYRFADLGERGVPYQESYASPAAADFDNNGHLDLYFTTVYPVASFGRPNHPELFRAEGLFDFEVAEERSGLGGLGATYEAAWADFDNDGDLDLATDGKLFVNQTVGSHWLKVNLVGDGEAVNRMAVGGQVRIKVGGSVYSRQVEAGTGEGNQNSPVLHFGFGRAVGPVDLEILWPGGSKQTVERVALNQTVRVEFR